MSVPRFGDELEALPGLPFSHGGKLYYEPGDRGRVSKEAYPCESDGIERFEVTWYSSGLTSSMRTNGWSMSFHATGSRLQVPSLGDRVRALPGIAFVYNGIEYYAPGDEGIVSKEAYVSPSDGVERFKVTWPRTGLTSTMKKSTWMKNFSHVMDGIPASGSTYVPQVAQASADGEDFVRTDPVRDYKEYTRSRSEIDKMLLLEKMAMQKEGIQFADWTLDSAWSMVLSSTTPCVFCVAPRTLRKAIRKLMEPADNGYMEAEIRDKGLSDEVILQALRDFIDKRVVGMFTCKGTVLACCSTYMSHLYSMNAALGLDEESKAAAYGVMFARSESGSIKVLFANSPWDIFILQ